ncbi:MAG: chorismate mutase [Oscillospiraceae bacterium]
MDLQDYRDRIDEVDTRLVELFQQRMSLSRQVADYKLEHGMEVLQPERERALLDRLSAMAEPDMAEYVRALYTEIMRLSRQEQQKRIEHAKKEGKA